MVGAGLQAEVHARLAGLSPGLLCGRWRLAEPLPGPFGNHIGDLAGDLFNEWGKEVDELLPGAWCTPLPWEGPRLVPQAPSGACLLLGRASDALRNLTGDKLCKTFIYAMIDKISKQRVIETKGVAQKCRQP